MKKATSNPSFNGTACGSPLIRGWPRLLRNLGLREADTFQASLNRSEGVTTVVDGESANDRTFSSIASREPRLHSNLGHPRIVLTPGF